MKAMKMTNILTAITIVFVAVYVEGSNDELDTSGSLLQTVHDLNSVISRLQHIVNAQNARIQVLEDFTQSQREKINLVKKNRNRDAETVKFLEGKLKELVKTCASDGKTIEDSDSPQVRIRQGNVTAFVN